MRRCIFIAVTLIYCSTHTLQDGINPLPKASVEDIGRRQLHPKDRHYHPSLYSHYARRSNNNNNEANITDLAVQLLQKSHRRSFSQPNIDSNNRRSSNPINYNSAKRRRLHPSREPNRRSFSPIYYNSAERRRFHPRHVQKKRGYSPIYANRRRVHPNREPNRRDKQVSTLRDNSSTERFNISGKIVSDVNYIPHYFERRMLIVSDKENNDGMTDTGKSVNETHKRNRRGVSDRDKLAARKAYLIKLYKKKKSKKKPITRFANLRRKRENKDAIRSLQAEIIRKTNEEHGNHTRRKRYLDLYFYGEPCKMGMLRYSRDCVPYIDNLGTGVDDPYPEDQNENDVDKNDE